jgi:hypothetical protein
MYATLRPLGYALLRFAGLRSASIGYALLRSAMLGFARVGFAWLCCMEGVGFGSLPLFLSRREGGR